MRSFFEQLGDIFLRQRQVDLGIGQRVARWRRSRPSRRMPARRAMACAVAGMSCISADARRLLRALGQELRFLAHQREDEGAVDA